VTAVTTTQNAEGAAGDPADRPTPTPTPAPLPRWPGALEAAGPAQVFVRRAPATSPGAAPAVMVHGLGGSATNWTDLMGLLRDRLDSAALDLPGFGWSPPPAGSDYRIAAHARAVVDFLESDGRAPVHLFGNSLGGSVATLVAAARPDLVRTLTLVSPALPVRLPRRSNAHLPALAAPWIGQRLAARLDRYPVESRVRATMALCFGDPTGLAPERFAEAVEEADRRARLGYESEAMLSSLRNLVGIYLRHGGSWLWDAAAAVQAPTLLVYGLRDKLVDPRSSRRATRTFPTSRLLIIPDSGHVAMMEHPDEVARAVRRHLDAPTGRRPATAA
jgi:pimeloyl-ACP methyl ester carboxylesterase